MPKKRKRIIEVSPETWDHGAPFKWNQGRKASNGKKLRECAVCSSFGAGTSNREQFLSPALWMKAATAITESQQPHPTPGPCPA